MLLFIKSIILKKSRGDKMEKKETRGAKKGRPKPAGSGRKATGLIRKEAITIKFTEEEKEFVNKELRKIAPTKTEAMLKLLKYKSLVDWGSFIIKKVQPYAALKGVKKVAKTLTELYCSITVA